MCSELGWLLLTDRLEILTKFQLVSLIVLFNIVCLKIIRFVLLRGPSSSMCSDFKLSSHLIDPEALGHCLVHYWRDSREAPKSLKIFVFWLK